nr:hypothetical protein [Trichocoleus desertorum]
MLLKRSRLSPSSSDRASALHQAIAPATFPQLGNATKLLGQRDRH